MLHVCSVGEVYPDTTANKRRTRAKQNSNTPNPKRQCPPRKRSPKKGNKQDGDSNLQSHTILPRDIFQDDTSQHIIVGRRGNDHTGSDFAILAEQILDDQLPMESDSNLTELLIPVDSGWMEHTKSVAKQHEDMSHRRPPPVSELFKLTRPPEMDEPSTELTPGSYDNFSSAPDVSWSSPTTPSHVTSTTSHSKPQDTVMLPTLLSTAPTSALSAEIDQHTLLSPGNTIGTEVEEVYAQYPDQGYDQGLEVNTDNIIISEPNREY